MTPAIMSPVLKSVYTLGAALPAPREGIVLAVLLLALVAKVVLQSAMRFPLRDALRLLDVILAPLLVVFVIVVLERFRDLSY